MTNDQEKKENKATLLKEEERALVNYDRGFKGFLDKLYEVTRPSGDSRDDGEDS